MYSGSSRGERNEETEKCEGEEKEKKAMTVNKKRQWRARNLWRWGKGGSVTGRMEGKVGRGGDERKQHIVFGWDTYPRFRFHYKKTESMAGHEPQVGNLSSSDLMSCICQQLSERNR